MSESACKTILCSGGAIAVIRAAMITARNSLDPALADPATRTTLELAANAAEWEAHSAIEVIHLLAEQKFKITQSDAYQLIHALDTIETELPGLNATQAIAFLEASARDVHAGILHLHLAVTGEAADYQVHGVV